MAYAPLLAPLCSEGPRLPLCESPVRWAVLATVAMMPFGIHVCYKMTSGIQTHLINDAFEPPITTFQYGLLNSAVSWFNLVVPFFAGPLVDRRATRIVGIASAVVGLMGQFLFALGVQTQTFHMAVIGRSVFGMGEGAVLIAQGAAIAQWFRGAELTFAIAITEMSHNLANWAGKIAVTIGVEVGGWWVTLWIGVLLCVLGVVAACIFGVIERRYEFLDSSRFDKHGAPMCKSLSKLTVSFWIIIVIHLLVSNVEHLFDTTSANFIQGKWHDNTSKAAWLSSLNYVFAILLCPLAGIIIDKSAWRMPLAMLACCLMGCAHLLLGLTNVAPAVGLIALSLPEAIMPTILRSSAPLVVNPSVFGMAFGVFGIAENLGKTIGAPLIGYVRDQDGNYLHVELGYATASFVASVFVILLFASDRRSGGKLVPRRRGVPVLDEEAPCSDVAYISVG